MWTIHSMQKFRWFDEPERLYTLAVAAILGLLLWFYWPTLHDGLYADDYTAAAMIDGTFAAPRGPLDLFKFADGTPEDVRALQRLGSLPWWAPPDFRISFLRPLSSALWHVDRALFGTAYGGYHAHSLAVFFVLVIAASLLYRRLLSLGVAAMATLMFAIDDSHHFPVVWLSNRGGIYAVLCGVLALLAHVRWRREQKPLFAVASALAITIGLLFGEWVLPMLAYIFAFELLGMQGPLRKRALALLPCLVPCAAFLVCRASLHYGARGSGDYIDPGVEPLRFLFALTHRIPVFFADMVWNVPAEWWDHGTPWRDELLSRWIVPPQVWLKLPSWHVFHLALGVLALLAVSWAMYFCHRGLTPDERRQVRWLTLGALGALAPVVGSFASTRLTIPSMLGLTPLFALTLREVARKLRAAVRIHPAEFAGYYALVFAIVHLQVYLPLQGNIQAQVDHYLTTSHWVLDAQLDPQRVAEQRVFLIAGAEFTTTFYFSYIWSHSGRPLPRSYYPITASPCAHYVDRTADNELLLRALGGYYLDSGEENMFRAPTRRWREGETMELAGMRVKTEQVVRGVPGALRLTFDRSVDDPSFVFLIAAPYGLVRFDPPPSGEQRLITRASYPNWTDLQRHHYIVRMAPLPETLHFASIPGFLNYKPDRQ